MRGSAIKERKRDEANARQELRDARGEVGQLDRLEANGHGDCREAVRLRTQVAAAQALAEKEKTK